jgi:hypothetical protein
MSERGGASPRRLCGRAYCSCRLQRNHVAQCPFRQVMHLLATGLAVLGCGGEAQTARLD